MVYGIIAEYNPFHQGHRYLIRQVKNEEDFVIAVMSGHFVQRGDFAIQPKWERAKAALQNGVDLVLELPTPFSLKSAEGFALAGVELLHKTGCVDRLLFGAETAELPLLQAAADFLESTAFPPKIREQMKTGLSFPAARQQAAGFSVLKTPNNILAVEYLKALHRLHTPIQPVAIQRIGAGHDSAVSDPYPSASFLRAEMANRQDVCQAQRCETAILSTLRRMNAADFRKIEDVNEGLEHRLETAVKTARSLEEVYTLTKSKRYPHARIRRIILRAFLGIKRGMFSELPYLRVLGFHQRALPLLKELKTHAALPLVSKYGDLSALPPECRRLYQAECTFTDQYMMGFSPIRLCGQEMTQPIIKIGTSHETID